tara:strand:- start:533 stop:2302 length:1770 start_codon:yes stop_codon:yes gene_type:complete
MGAVENIIADNLPIWSSAVQSKSSARRGASSKRKLYGVKKLRELILDLAVRGLLVPQDLNDAPTSVLVNKIAAEREQRINAGTMKKPKELNTITDEEKIFNVPNTWTYHRLGEIATIIRGITFPASEKSQISATGRVACIRTTNVQDRIEWDDLLFIRTEYVKREDQYLLQGDIVISMANSRELVGKVALVSTPPATKSSFGGFLAVIRTKGFSPDFLMYQLRSTAIRQNLIDSASQTTNIANISMGKLNPLVIGVPPLAEQHRIVAKVDELMALCDTLEQQQEDSIQAHETLVEALLEALTSAVDADAFQDAWQRISEYFDVLFTTEHSIDKLKETILQLAVMGKLVPQDPSDEPASVLLEKISIEKKKLVTEGKIKKSKTLGPITDKDLPFVLPSGWSWCRLPEIGELARGKSKHRPRNDPSLYSGGDIPLVQTGDVARASKIINTYSSLYNQKGLSQSRMWPAGTMCITIAANIADSGLLGFDACFPDSVVGFIPLGCQLDVRYFEYFLRTAKANLEKFAPSTAQKNINLEILGSLLVPLPPQQELNRIIAKIDQLMALCDQLKESLQQAQQTQIHLTDAVVGNAL